MPRRYALFVCCLFVISPPTAFAQSYVANGPRSSLEPGLPSKQDLPSWQELSERGPWLFLGDSNTYAGEYIALLDAWMRASQQATEHPLPQLLNLGVPSETASGLSEVDHPFKRPCVHERLTKILEMIKPGVVFVCYGMNDGIYQPPSTENLRSYQQGMLKLTEAIRAETDAVLICLTPPIFEPEPVAARGQLGPSDAGRFAYFAPAENYNETLQQQAEWCLKNEMQADLVIDLQTLLADAKREKSEQQPDFNFSVDGIHFGSEAHQLIAGELARELGAPERLSQIELSETQLTTAKRRMEMLRDAYLTATGKNRPGLPAGLPIWYVEQMIEDGL